MPNMGLDENEVKKEKNSNESLHESNEIPKAAVHEHHPSFFGLSTENSDNTDSRTCLPVLAETSNSTLESNQDQAKVAGNATNVSFCEGNTASTSTAQLLCSSDELIINDLEMLKRKNIQLEQELFIANEQQSFLQSKLLKLNEIVESQKSELDLSGKDRNQRILVLQELQSERDQLMLLKNQSEEKAELLHRQKEDLEAQVNHLTHDKNLLTADVHSFKTTIEKLVQNISNLEGDITEMKKERRLFEFEKERWMREKDLFIHNKEWFMNELKDRDNKLTVLKVESLRLANEIKAEKDALAEECENLRTSLNEAKNVVKEKEELVDDLNKKIREVLEEKSTKTNKLEEELMTTERLISVYKETIEETERNLQELSEEYDEREKILDEAKREYEALRLNLDEQKSRYEAERKQQDDQIKELRDELLKANELLKSKHGFNFSEEEIAELSPSAAAASMLIKKGVSLTAIYKEHSRIVSELEDAKVENRRLEEYIKEFVMDLEKNAPLLSQQREKYDKMNELCSNLRQQLQNADEDHAKLISARDSAARELAYTKAELERAQRDNDNLAKQVRHLLYVSEVNKIFEEGDVDSFSVSDEDRNILWASISQLQDVNQKLMSDLSTIKANQKQAVLDANEIEINRLSEALDSAVKKLESLKDQLGKQNSVIETLEQQRDLYKSKFEEKEKENEGKFVSKELDDAKDLVKQLRLQIERSEKCLGFYREEKMRSEKIMQDRIDQQFALISELRTTNGKLEANAELQKQVQSTLEKQAETDSVELDTMKEKLEKILSEKKILEERFKENECRLVQATAEVDKLKNEVNLANNEVTALRYTETRLQQQLFDLQGNYSTNEKIVSTLQQLQSHIGKLEEDKVKRLEDQLNIMRNENQELKTFIGEVTEQHRIFSQDMKITSNKIKDERDQALSSKKFVEDHLATKINELGELQVKYDTLIKQLNAPESSLDTTAEGCRKEAQQLRNRNNYLENQLKDARADLEGMCFIKYVKKKLLIKENEVKEMTKLCGSVEATLVEQNTTNAAETNTLKESLEKVTEQFEESLKTISQLRGDITILEEKCAQELTHVELIKVESQKEVTEMERRFIESENKRRESEQNVEETLNRFAKVDGEMKAVGYLVTVVKLLKEDREKLKEEISNLEDKLLKCQNLLNFAEASKVEKEAEINTIKTSYENEMAVIRIERSKYEETLNELRECKTLQEKKIEALNDNLVKLSQRNAFLEKAGLTGEGSEFVGCQSTNALTDIIKYLQTENEQAMERTLAAEVQCKRLQAQVSDLEELRTTLEEELKKSRVEIEAGVRALSEKSAMVSRLSLLENSQKENASLKEQIEEFKQCECSLAKKVETLESRLRQMESNKTAFESRIRNLTTDLQNCRKEADSWKQRHTEALNALSRVGPEKPLTEEMETLKRQVVSLTTELENGKRQVEESATKHKLEVDNLSVTIRQLRILAKSYKAKYLALSNEKRELSDKKPLSGETSEKQSSSNELETEITSLKQQLLAARHEIEKLKQGNSGQEKIVSTAPRTSVEPAVGSPSKGPSVLQAQMKQIESLNSLNKDLKNQLETLANRYKEAQDELVEARTNVEECHTKMTTLQTEKDAKEEELRFRLNSVTSMVTKKDAELNKSKSQVENLKIQLDSCSSKVQKLEAALENCRKKNDRTPAAGDQGESEMLEPITGSSALPMSSSSSVVSQFGSEASMLLAPASNQNLTSGAASEDSVINVGESAASLAHGSISSAAKNSDGLADVLRTAKKQVSVSTTFEQPLSAESSSGKDILTKPTTTLPDNFGKIQSPVKIQKGATAILSTNKGNFSSSLYATNKAQQSSTISQSSGTVFSPPVTTATQLNKPAQHNVISGSGDGLNVISSSGASNSSDLSSNCASLSTPQKSIAFSNAVRKRPILAPSDQLSSAENGSDLQETVKRQRISPSEQVSTSGRFLQQSSESSLPKDKGVTLEDDGADQEQQESVETTTNPENDAANSDCIENDSAKSTNVQRSTDESREAASGGNQIEEEGEEEGYPEEIDGEGGDEEAPEDDDPVREEEYLDEALGEGGEEEYEDEMEEDEDYEEEEDYEGVEEEVPDVRGHRPLLIAPRSVRKQQQRPVDDEEVIVIEDDDEDDEVSHSQSPADQSTDEADEGPRVPVYCPDTSDEPSRAHLDNNDAHDSAEGSDHLELQQSRKILETSRVAGLKASDTGNADSEVSAVPSDAMELSRADTTANSRLAAEGTFEEEKLKHLVSLIRQKIDTLSTIRVIFDCWVVSVNMDADSRGASSTVSPAIGQDSEHSVKLVEEDGGNEVADEELASKPSTGVKTGQTDDETAVFEPSTSVDSRQRRMRILYPDVDEPSSSSVDRLRIQQHQVRGRGGWAYRSRRGHMRSRP
uniref:TMF_TATA_bd domain-containing protein n=1 Tax=Syphacia muris TaxID=451379 RepID=A0A0N5AU60_9BILA